MFDFANCVSTLPGKTRSNTKQLLPAVHSNELIVHNFGRKSFQSYGR